MGDIDSALLVFLKKIKDENGKSINVISGECSDEIFGGYPWYYKKELMLNSYFPWADSKEIRLKLLKKDLISTVYFENYIQNAYNNTKANVILNSKEPLENEFKSTCYLTIKWFMQTLVERTNTIAEFLNMDVRIPFASYKLFEYVYNISAKEKLGLNIQDTPIEKFILKTAFKDFLPQEIFERKKSPFPKTYSEVYTLMLEKEIEKIIRDSTSPVLDIIDVKYLLEITKNHGLTIEKNWFGQLMKYPQILAYIIQINIWLKEYDVQIQIED